MLRLIFSSYTHCITIIAITIESRKTGGDYNKTINIFNVHEYCKAAGTLPEHLRKKKKKIKSYERLLCTPGGLIRHDSQCRPVPSKENRHCNALIA